LFPSFTLRVRRESSSTRRPGRRVNVTTGNSAVRGAVVAVMTDVGIHHVIAITGASSGIGEATARHLAARGARLVIGARRTDRLEVTADELRAGGAEVVTAAVDVRRRADVERLVQTAVDRFGRLDVLVSNAGISKLSALAEGDVDGWSAMIDVNLRGVLNGIAAAMPVFRAQGNGHFVTTVSTAGLQMAPTMGVYAATKNAVRTVMEALRLESTDGVVRTTSISPGYVRTELGDSVDDPEMRARIRSNMDAFGLDPAAVARAVAFAIEQPHDVEIGDITIRPTVQG
jgi:NADP-dependent 3-hydroxy acid dehydrogenase YdfG